MHKAICFNKFTNLLIHKYVYILGYITKSKHLAILISKIVNQFQITSIFHFKFSDQSFLLKLCIILLH